MVLINSPVIEPQSDSESNVLLAESLEEIPEKKALEQINASRKVLNFKQKLLNNMLQIPSISREEPLTEHGIIHSLNIHSKKIGSSETLEPENLFEKGIFHSTSETVEGLKKKSKRGRAKKRILNRHTINFSPMEFQHKRFVNPRIHQDLQVEQILSVRDCFEVDTKYKVSLFLNVEQREDSPGKVLTSLLVSFKNIHQKEQVNFQIMKMKKYLFLIKQKVASFS